MRIDSFLRCPKCKSQLHKFEDTYECMSDECKLTFASIMEIPVLVDPANEIFNHDNLSNDGAPFFGHQSRLVYFIKKFIPNISHNISAASIYSKLASSILPPSPKILIIGSGVGGDGIEFLRQIKSPIVVKTDVYVSSGIDYICDAHTLPFANDVFDLVIIQAVLEHLLNPEAAVNEIHRVLTTTGLVYSEVPFIQQVHGGKFDFTRFTKSGHRYLFKRFSEIDSGQCGGVGMALAWSIEYFIKGILPNKYIGTLIAILTRYFTFWLKHLDRWAIKYGSNSDDGASAFYFLGAKSQEIFSEVEIINYYQSR